tara:strand:- start:120 stop:470 length:351 start_codon:yes stop_codon:yes gene_type:complete
MNDLQLLNKNIIYFYIDLFNSSDKSELKYSTLFEIQNIIKNEELYFVNIIKEHIYENYKNDILEENINVLEILDNVLVLNFDLIKIYNKVKKKNKKIIWDYLKIFVVLYEKHYFTL